MNMADEQSKNNNIKLMKGRVQKISKDEILEVTGKGKPFTLSKDLINNKKEYLSDKFTPLVPNDYSPWVNRKIALNMKVNLVHQMRFTKIRKTQRRVFKNSCQWHH